MVQIFDTQGNVVATSQNLRGILDYARREPVICVVMHELTAGDADLFFKFFGGQMCFVHFNDANVAHHWLLNRHSWGKPDISGDGVCAVYIYMEV